MPEKHITILQLNTLSSFLNIRGKFQRNRYRALSRIGKSAQGAGIGKALFFISTSKYDYSTTSALHGTTKNTKG
jgi:hypothetical protein